VWCGDWFGLILIDDQRSVVLFLCSYNNPAAPIERHPCNRRVTDGIVSSNHLGLSRSGMDVWDGAPGELPTWKNLVSPVVATH
jgi:hypothetical protein